MKGRLAVIWPRLSPVLKNLLSPSLLTGGFTLISMGVGSIFGFGAGMITAGVAMVLLGAPIVRD